MCTWRRSSEGSARMTASSAAARSACTSCSPRAIARTIATTTRPLRLEEVAPRDERVDLPHRERRRVARRLVDEHHRVLIVDRRLDEGRVGVERVALVVRERVVLVLAVADDDLARSRRRRGPPRRRARAGAPAAPARRRRAAPSATAADREAARSRSSPAARRSSAARRDRWGRSAAGWRRARSGTCRR